jgi:hypothetical protein
MYGEDDGCQGFPLSAFCAMPHPPTVTQPSVLVATESYHIIITGDIHIE